MEDMNRDRQPDWNTGQVPEVLAAIGVVAITPLGRDYTFGDGRKYRLTRDELDMVGETPAGVAGYLGSAGVGAEAENIPLC